MEALYRAYTKRYTHNDLEIVDGFPVYVTYEPQSICNTHEVEAIWSHFKNVDQALEAMHDRIGTPSAREARPFEELPR